MGAQSLNDYQFLFIWMMGLQLVITLVIAALSFRQAYNAKKGQNQADKEDIANLTRLVESVRGEISRETAKVQSGLDILKDKKGKNFTQAQQTIINFHTHFNSWLICMSAFYPTSADEAESRIKEINEFKKKANIESSLVELLTNDYDLHLKSIELIKMALPLHNMVSQACAHLIRDYKLFDLKIKYSGDSSSPLTESDYKNHYDSITNMMSILKTNYLEKYGLLGTPRNEYMRLAKKYLEL